jgi:hypothetical protein
LKAGINNVFNEQYATRRASGYPGPESYPVKHKHSTFQLCKILSRYCLFKRFSNENLFFFHNKIKAMSAAIRLSIPHAFLIKNSFEKKNLIVVTTTVVVIKNKISLLHIKLKDINKASYLFL